MRKVKIFIADDHKILRDGIKAVIESEDDFEVSGQASDGEEAVRKISELKPDVAIIDLNMPVLNGIQAIREVRAFDKNLRIIVLTMFYDGNHIREAIAAGADGYILKMSDMEVLLSAIRHVLKGERYFDREVSDTMLSDYVKTLSSPKPEMKTSLLTRRETDVVKLIASGLTSQQISEKLYISYFTVAEHRKNIMKKLEVRNTVELVNLALKENLV